MLSMGAKAGITTNGGWGLDAFTGDDVETIHHATLEHFEHVGIKMESREAADICDGAGCKVSVQGSGWNVRVPSWLVEECIRVTPRHVVLKGRSADYDYPVFPKSVSFTTFGELIKINDLHTGESRQCRQQDNADIARLCDALDDVKIIHRPVAALDKPLGTHPIFNAEVLFANSSKHINIGPINAHNLETMVKMAAAHVGGREAFKERGLFTTIICPNSPLRLETEAAEMIVASARNEGCGIVSHPVGLAGANNPITLPGIMVNHNVEALSALVLAQLTRKGTRVLFGSVATIMDMKTMTTPFGSPEMAMLSAANVKMAQFYGLPSIVAGAHTDSKVLDAQVGYESAIGGLLNALAGANFIYGIGTMEDALTFDYAKFMMDIEMSRMIQRIIGGVQFTADEMAMDVTRQVGPGGEFIATRHTFNHMRDNWSPALFDRQGRDKWAAMETTDLAERARAQARQIVETHQPAPVSEDTQREIREIMAEYLSEKGIEA